MIDKAHDLPVVRQVQLLDLARSTAYYRPQPISESDLQLMREIDLSSRLLLKVAKPTKLNTAALGNIVEQLHVHVVARHVGDAAWPGPIWGVGQAEARDDAYWMNERQVLLEALAGLDDPSDVAISAS